MVDGVVLEEMIFTGVSRDLELTTNTDAAVEVAALLDASMDLGVVVLEVQRVGIETAESHLHVKLPKSHAKNDI